MMRRPNLTGFWWTQHSAQGSQSAADGKDRQPRCGFGGNPPAAVSYVRFGAGGSAFQQLGLADKRVLRQLSSFLLCCGFRLEHCPPGDAEAYLAGLVPAGSILEYQLDHLRGAPPAHPSTVAFTNAYSSSTHLTVFNGRRGLRQIPGPRVSNYSPTLYSQPWDAPTTLTGTGAPYLHVYHQLQL